MQNQFCKNCGQANFPNATTCTKCGQALAQPGTDRAAHQSEPPPTMMGDAPFSPQQQNPPEKKSKMMYWIIGGVAVFLVLAVGAVLLAAVGIFIYTNSGSDEVASNDTNVERKSDDPKDYGNDRDTGPDDSRDTRTGDSDNPLDDISFPSGKDVDFGDDTASTVTNASLLKFFLQKKSKVGRFNLVKATTSDDKTVFPNRDAGIQAEYKSGRVKITHRVAIYRSLDAARGDIATYRRGIRQAGARIRSSKEDQVIFTLKGLVYLAFYNPQGGLHEISSRNGNSIVRYYNSYFKQ